MIFPQKELVDVLQLKAKEVRMAMFNGPIGSGPIGAAPIGANIDDKPTPVLLLQTALLDLGPKTSEGQIVQVVMPPWLQLCLEIEHNPEFLFEFVANPRRFEEFIAGAYEQDGWQVELTPASHDLGRDVIATKPGYLAIRVLDQCKALSPGRVVDANDVRAMAGVLLRDQNVSKGVVTTTSTFAPGIANEFVDLIPYRLDLRDGAALAKWLKEISGESKE